MIPSVSIIIPCYNHGDFIEDAIKSIEQCNDKTLYEIVIVDDGSTDKVTQHKLLQLKQQGYNVISQENKGLGAARNTGIEASKAKYILPLDSDNKIHPEYIFKAAKVLDENENISVVYADAEYFGGKTGRWSVGEYSLQKLMLGNYIDACSVFRKSVWEKAGRYDEKMPFMGLEDWDLWLRFSFNGFKFQYLPQVLFYYRVQDSSMLKSLSFSKNAVLNNYIEKKYRGYLDRKYLNDFIISRFSDNKRLFFKLLLLTYFPRLVKWLEKKELIKSETLV